MSLLLRNNHNLQQCTCFPHYLCDFAPWHELHLSCSLRFSLWMCVWCLDGCVFIFHHDMRLFVFMVAGKQRCRMLQAQGHKVLGLYQPCLLEGSCHRNRSQNCWWKCSGNGCRECQQHQHWFCRNIFNPNRRGTEEEKILIKWLNCIYAWRETG